MAREMPTRVAELSIERKSNSRNGEQEYLGSDRTGQIGRLDKIELLNPKGDRACWKNCVRRAKFRIWSRFGLNCSRRCAFEPRRVVQPKISISRLSAKSGPDCRMRRSFRI